MYWIDGIYEGRPLTKKEFNDLVKEIRLLEKPHNLRIDSKLHRKLQMLYFSEMSELKEVLEHCNIKLSYYDDWGYTIDLINNGE